MQISFSCANCNARLRVEETQIANALTCPKCGSPFAVPIADMGNTANAGPPVAQAISAQPLPRGNPSSPGQTSVTSNQSAPGRKRLWLIASSLIVLFVVAGLAWMLFFPAGMSRDELIGEWIYVPSEDSTSVQVPAFGISFHEDGTYSVFKTSGDSWTGEFLWMGNPELGGLGDGMEIAGMSGQRHNLGYVDQRAEVETDDGIILVEPSSPGVSLAGWQDEEIYLRRDDSDLLLGFWISHATSRDEEQLEAGWIRLSSAPPRPDLIAELKAVEEEPTPSDSPVADRLNISLAVVLLVEGIDGRTFDGSIVNSEVVDSNFLFRKFGLPDEARAVRAGEIPSIPGISFERSQLLRYGSLSFVMTQAGKLQYLARAKE